MRAGPGHNNGPSMESGKTWRKHCWTKARANLIPHLPIEILRGRVRRAKELGLDYKTYASVRASTGRDVIGFLFSSNALRAFRHVAVLPEDRAVKLDALQDCSRVAMVSKPLTVERLLAENPEGVLDHAALAPDLLSNWPECRERVFAALQAQRLPADGVIMIGDTTLEREWSVAGRLAAYFPAERYFSGAGV
ncbi:MAG: hypothetical protein ACU0CA_05000 [Paracoccaceae bacterium]